jgi:hypothetical protein
MKKTNLILLCLVFLAPGICFADADGGTDCYTKSNSPVKENFSQDPFESPDGWSIESTGSNVTWRWVEHEDETSFETDNFIYMPGVGLGTVDETLVTPWMVIKKLTNCENPVEKGGTFSFKMIRTEENEGAFVNIRVRTLHEDGTPSEWRLDREQFVTDYPAESYRWEKWSFDLGNELLWGTIQFGIRVYSSEPLSVGIDDVRVQYWNECCESWVGGSDDDDSGGSCGISTKQSATVLTVVMLVIGLYAMAIGAKRGKGPEVRIERESRIS